MNWIMPVPMDFVSKLGQTLKRFSFSHFGCTPLAEPLSLALYQEWLSAGHHGTMEYLATHLPLKADPARFAARAHSAIVIAQNYFPHPYASAQVLSARTALYAAGEDYHSRFKAELEVLAQSLRMDFPGEEFLCFTDSAPVLERDLAARAGLGWVGKNSCLIHPEKGSLFFIGEILTSLALESPEALVPDFCGTCDRCLKACPTQALVAPRVLDARKCISYWTIEAKTEAPLELRAKLGDWFFGCDICQTVCPWNEKVFGREKMRALSLPVLPIQDALIPDLRRVLRSSNKSLTKAFANLPYDRARAHGLKRNALYVIANLKLAELKPEVLMAYENPRLTDLAAWTLSCLDAAAAEPT